MFDRIDHVGIAVEEIEQALELWSRRLGMVLAHREVVDSQGLEAAMLDVGDGRIELMAPLGADTPVGKFIAKRGPGMHHIAYTVGDIDRTLAELRDAGFPLIDEEARIGLMGHRVAFLHHDGTGRVLTELVEHRPGGDGDGDLVSAHGGGEG